MCKSKKPKTPKPPKPPDNNYWAWWNYQDVNKGVGGNYRLNDLAIGNVLEASKGTSQLKNIRTLNTQDTTGVESEAEKVYAPIKKGNS